jgi:hypothetical protein
LQPAMPSKMNVAVSNKVGRIIFFIKCNIVEEIRKIFKKVRSKSLVIR